jgi:4-amino-4-deoxy-L-arabinose transferase-like glycosyltransferase
MSTSEYPATRFGSPRLPKLRAVARAKSVPADVWVLGVLITVAAVIRIITIDNQSFWMDEALTAYEAHLPFGAMINTVAHVETTPPLYFVLIWAWGHVFGTSEVALRSVSLLAGVALVPVAYLAARELVSRWAGVLAAAFVAVNPFLIWYSQEARAYMLLATLSGASFLFFVRARREPSRGNLACWTVFSSLAMMTHFFAGFVVAPEALWLLWIARTRIAALAVATVAVTQVAMLPFAFIDTSHGVGWIAAVPRIDRVGQTLLEWGVSILYRRASNAEGFVGGALLALTVLALLVLGGDRYTRSAAKVAVAIAGFALLAPLALGFFGQDYFLSRNLIPAFVPVATLIAAACLAPRARLLGGVLAIGLLAMFSVAAARVQTHPGLERPNWRAVAHALGAAPVRRAVLVSNGTTADPLKLYMPHVSWVQPQTRPTVIREIDVVGATKRLALVPLHSPVGIPMLLSAAPPPFPPAPTGSPLPSSVAPVGARLIARFRVDSWVVARFALRRPIRVTVLRLGALAPSYFRRTPFALLVFFQQPGR